MPGVAAFASARGMSNAPETSLTTSAKVWCDGAGQIRSTGAFKPAALGHPRVWLEMGGEPFVECGYCDRRFVLFAGEEGHEDERLAPGVYEAADAH